MTRNVDCEVFFLHAFETTCIWDHMHLRPHAFEITFIWDQIYMKLFHLRPLSFAITFILRHVKVGLFRFTVYQIFIIYLPLFCRRLEVLWMKVSCECGLKWKSFMWMRSQMNRSQMLWSQMNGLKWIGLTSHGTIFFIGVSVSHCSTTLQYSWWHHSFVCPICFCFYKVNVLAPSNVYISTAATYVSSSSFEYLCVPVSEVYV